MTVSLLNELERRANANVRQRKNRISVSKCGQVESVMAKPRRSHLVHIPSVINTVGGPLLVKVLSDDHGDSKIRAVFKIDTKSQMDVKGNMGSLRADNYNVMKQHEQKTDDDGDDIADHLHFDDDNDSSELTTKRDSMVAQLCDQLSKHSISDYVVDFPITVRDLLIRDYPQDVTSENWAEYYDNELSKEKQHEYDKMHTDSVSNWKNKMGPYNRESVSLKGAILATIKDADRLSKAKLRYLLALDTNTSSDTMPAPPSLRIPVHKKGKEKCYVCTKKFERKRVKLGNPLCGTCMVDGYEHSRTIEDLLQMTGEDRLKLQSNMKLLVKYKNDENIYDVIIIAAFTFENDSPVVLGVGGWLTDGKPELFGSKLKGKGKLTTTRLVNEEELKMKYEANKKQKN